MMSLGNWLRVLIVVVLLGNLVEFVLPRGDLKRYGGLVVGLVVLATMVSPLWGWMHALGTRVNTVPTSWTNTASGFTNVVEQEEVHQAESIVMSMPHVTDCRITLSSVHHVIARVTVSQPVGHGTVRKYLAAALQVTMADTPDITMVVIEPTSQAGHAGGHIHGERGE